jgi:hypothetical protein
MLLRKLGHAAAIASLAVQLFDILLGSGTLFFGACPSLRSSGVGTAADGGASSLASESSPLQVSRQTFKIVPLNDF